MPKSNKLIKPEPEMVQHHSPELFKVEKKKITEKPFEVNNLVGRLNKVDFWDEELKIL